MQHAQAALLQCGPQPTKNVAWVAGAGSAAPQDRPSNLGRRSSSAWGTRRRSRKAARSARAQLPQDPSRTPRGPSRPAALPVLSDAAKPAEDAFAAREQQTGSRSTGQAGPAAEPAEPSQGERWAALEAEVQRLRGLIAALAAAGADLVARERVLHTDPRVARVFPAPEGAKGGARWLGPAVRLAQKHLAPQQVHLLMLLCAAGQGHLLDTPSTWGLPAAESDMEEAPSEPADEKWGLKGALTMLGSLVLGWQKEAAAAAASAPASGDAARPQSALMSDAEAGERVLRNVSISSTVSGLLQGLENPGVFPAPVMEMVNWEGKRVGPGGSEVQLLTWGPAEGEFLTQFLDAFDNPGVFPVPILEMFDIEGRYTDSALDVWLGLARTKEGGVGVEVEMGPAAAAGHAVDAGPSAASEVDEEQAVRELRRLCALLQKMDKFYDSIGGVLGYQAVTLDLIVATERAEEQAKRWAQDTAEAGPTTDAAEQLQFRVPPGADLAQDEEFASRAALWGLEGLPDMAELYPLGGAGDRLGLLCPQTGEPLPVAMLRYCGRTLLEGLIRDLQAREYLHYRVFGTRHITPVAIMTSAAKRNNERVHGLCESKAWFGRGSANFKLFEQPLVPAVAAGDGHWPVHGPLHPVLKPGGHGVVWKLAQDEGVLDWLIRDRCRTATLVRQISNPMAGTDTTLLALAGVGLQGKKKFGFASCDRNVGAAEGVNVLMEEARGDGTWASGVTCVEYTEFDKLGIIDSPVSSGSMKAALPANTNVLYADLRAVQGLMRSAAGAASDEPDHADATASPGLPTRSEAGGAAERLQSHEQASSSREAGAGQDRGLLALPGMILNLKKPVVYCDNNGQVHSVRAGRLECTMQNIADSFKVVTPTRLPQGPECEEALDTFLLYNDRRKVTSSAKRKLKPGDLSLHQTPEGSFLDLMRNGRELLASCGVDMPKMESNQCYVDTHPPFIVLLHPALGPVWGVTRQKIRGGSMAAGSEVQLELAELLWEDVHVQGSLLVEARNVMGSMEPNEAGEPILQYGQSCGRCRLERVSVHNRGMFWEHQGNVFWQQGLVRHECARVLLHGDAEFDARDVVIEGEQLFEVPAGHRMIVRGDSTGGMSVRLDPLQAGQPSWVWQYRADATATPAIQLALEEHY